MPKDQRTLVVFYSLEGNTKLIAETIARAVNADLLELRPEKSIRPTGSLRYLWGGRQVLMRKRPPLLPLDRDPAKYDIIFIGCPVWAWSPAPPIRSFLESCPLDGKKVALFCTHEGGPGKTMKKWRAMLPRSEVLGEFDTFAPLKKDRKESCKNAARWARDIVDG